MDRNIKNMQNEFAKGKLKCTHTIRKQNLGQGIEEKHMLRNQLQPGTSKAHKANRRDPKMLMTLNICRSIEQPTS